MSATYLVLHGYYQSAEIIKKKLKAVIPKSIKDPSNDQPRDLELIIPNAPLNIDDDKYGWFPLDKIDLTNGVVTIDDNDISTVLNYDLGTSINRFDGVIAFSQGCLAAAVLLGSGKIHTSKLLLFSPIPTPKHIPWKYTLPTGIKCKVYLGCEDTLVPSRYSLEFIHALGHNDIEITEHRWGHVIPSTQHYKLEYNSFFGWNLPGKNKVPNIVK